ncbi:hypothetical protein ATI61_1302 [Archangium gephyra]|uniref:Uncharacterized protein n=1 Tax=Archangium gephyra TaxID=48 RepID=A0AAC8TJJ9_9BACT|nr:hypothetical protein [Archangium gephyra]AKJ08428.1 Hypothetical protein AA314_10054 [Archangium gephyra]REG14247.1 hypothetical protein ATI61_1302 [Archangium gephyra]
MNETTFTFVSVCGPLSLQDELLEAVLYLGPLVGIPLLLWLRRGPRDDQDVLGSARVAPASLSQRLLDFSGWLLLSGAVLLLPAGVTALIHFMMFFRIEDDLLPMRHRVLEPSWGWTAAAVLLCCARLFLWLRTPGSEQDVLRVRART